MTLAEKASQTDSNLSPAIPRLGVPATAGGTRRCTASRRSRRPTTRTPAFLQNTTSYPINQAIGASLDPDLEYQISSNISDEAREVMPTNSENLDFYSPTMNIERDPRWGRNDESWGEDPLLESKLVSQFVDGMEGKDSNGQLLRLGRRLQQDHHHAQALHGQQQRDQPPQRRLRRGRPHAARVRHQAVRRGRPGLAPGLDHELLQRGQRHAVAGQPYLMQTLARETFGFNGYFTSDCDAVYEITNGHQWPPPGWTRPINPIERNGYAMSSGEDLDCNTGYHDNYNYLNSLPTDTQQRIKTRPTRSTSTTSTPRRCACSRRAWRPASSTTRRTVPWVTQARTRVPSWTNSNANNAVTETPDAPRAGPQGRRREARAAQEPERAAAAEGRRASGAYKVAVHRLLRQPVEHVPRRLLEHPGRRRRGQRGQRLQRHQVGDPRRSTPTPRSTTRRASPAPARRATLTTVDPAAVAAAANYDAVDRLRGHRHLDRQRGPGPHHAAAPGRAERADPAGRGRQPEHDRLHGDGRPDRRLAVRVHRPGDPLQLLQRHAQGRGAGRRAARHVQPERPPALDLVPQRRADAGDDGLLDPPERDQPAAPTSTSRARPATRSATASATRRSSTPTCSSRATA